MNILEFFEGKLAEKGMPPAAATTVVAEATSQISNLLGLPEHTWEVSIVGVDPSVYEVYLKTVYLAALDWVSENDPTALYKMNLEKECDLE